MGFPRVLLPALVLLLSACANPAPAPQPGAAPSQPQPAPTQPSRTLRVVIRAEPGSLSGVRLIPTIFRTTGRNIRKRLNGIANASNGGTKSAASGGLKRTT